MTNVSALARNQFTYDEWMRSLVNGQTPSGEELARVSFVDEDEHYCNFADVEVVGEVTFVRPQFDDDGFFQLQPGSIVISKEPAIAQIDNRAGIQVHIRPR